MNEAAIPALLTGIALFAVVAALRGISVIARGTPVGASLAALYRLLAAMLMCRLLIEFATGASATLVVVVTMLIVSWLPLAGLRLVEELCRRHAPRLVKLWALGGAFGFSFVALTVGFVWNAAALIALALFQGLTIALMIWLLVRHRGDLARAERATADTFLIALSVAIPLVLTDFRALFPDLPVRGGCFAILLMVLATSRLVDGGGAPRRLLGDLALCLGGGGLVALAMGGKLAAISAGAAISLGAALTALALLIERFSRGRSGDDGLIGALARIDDPDPQALLSAHPLLASGRIVEGDALADYPVSALAALTRHRVVSDATRDADARDAARDLLDAHSATHLVRLNAAPPRFLAISAGSFAAQRTTDELALLARLVEARA